MINEHWEIVKHGEDSKTQDALYQEFKFKDFADALVFVNKVGDLAEKSNHHPDISFTWGIVKIWLTTHSKGGITDNDHKLALDIDKIKI